LAHISPPSPKESFADGNNNNNNEVRNNNKVRDDNKDAMPPKGRKAAATTKKPAAATTMPSPTPWLLVNFSVESTGEFAVADYCEGTWDYADVVIHINRVIRKSKYCVSITQDRTSVSWQCSVLLVCFTKGILSAIIGVAYSSTNHRIITYDDVA
jgi:hypothetical protein